jgi:hypothetical protein
MDYVKPADVIGSSVFAGLALSTIPKSRMAPPEALVAPTRVPAE